VVLALLASLLAQYAYPPREPQALSALYGRLSLSVAKRLNAGDRNSGILAWFVLVALVAIPVALATGVATSIHAVVLWTLELAALYASLRFLPTVRRLSEIERTLRAGDPGAAANLLSQWQAVPVEAEDADSIAKLAAEHALREAHHGAFAPLFWYLVLPGPLGLFLYPLALRAARSWEHLAAFSSVPEASTPPVDRPHQPQPGDRDFGWFAERAFFVIDWIPQRLSAFAFAVVGDFEDALFCWRSQASQWIRPEEGIVLASGAGALGVRLGDPVTRAGVLVDRPALGLGDPAREDALASLEGLLWRAFIVWLIVFLLAAALHAA
jgi:cobalamin biosynthesis protein CobD/CbiB